MRFKGGPKDKSYVKKIKKQSRMDLSEFQFSESMGTRGFMGLISPASSSKSGSPGPRTNRRKSSMNLKLGSSGLNLTKALSPDLEDVADKGVTMRPISRISEKDEEENGNNTKLSKNSGNASRIGFFLQKK